MNKVPNISESLNQLKQHYEKFGSSFDLSVNEGRSQLASLFGEERDGEFSAVMKKVRSGEIQPSEVYRLLNSTDEAIALFNQDNEESVGVGAWIVDQLDLRIETVRSIGEVGCGLGRLTDFLRDRFPECRVVGIDRDGSLLQFANESWERTEFENWDYEYSCYQGEPFSHMVGVFPILYSFSKGIRSEEFSRKVSTCFDNWSSALEDGGELILSPRINSLSEFKEMLWAAQDCDLSFRKDEYAWILAGEEKFSCMVFAKGETSDHTMSEEEIDLLWNSPADSRYRVRKHPSYLEVERKNSKQG